MNPLGRRLAILAMFSALVAVLLWFQGILFRHEPQVVTVPAPARLAAETPTGKARLERIPRIDRQPGFVEAIDPVDLAPRVMATILELGPRENDPVRADEPLVRLDDRDARARLAQAEAALQAAEAQALRAQLAFERAERLRKADALTQADWEAARSAHQTARADADRAREAVTEARTALEWFTLKAPFEGRVLARHADPGQLATPGRPLVSLYRPDRLRFRVAVAEQRVALLSIGQALEIDFDDLGSRRGVLERILPPADPSTGTVTLHFALVDPSDLRPGLLGSLHLPVGEREALLVPATAVERIGQIERVHWVRDGAVVPVVVKTGKRFGDEVEILSGLAPGEEVVVR